MAECAPAFRRAYPLVRSRTAYRYQGRGRCVDYWRLTPTAPVSSNSRPSRADSTPSRWHRHWPWVKRVALIAFALAVLGLIAWRAREIDWRAVLGALRALPLTTIALGAVVAAAAHAAFISYDLLARRYTRHPVSMGRTAAIAGVCFAFNLNLGALVGGVALRYRLYSRFGCQPRRSRASWVSAC